MEEIEKLYPANKQIAIGIRRLGGAVDNDDRDLHQAKCTYCLPEAGQDATG